MLETEYRKCPRYNKGPEFCCLARHERHLENFGQGIETIEFTEGRKISIPTYAFTGIEIEYDTNGNRYVWLSFLNESEEVVELQLTDLQKLTPESQEIIFGVHPGLETTPLAEDCPFNKARD